ncbi:MAG: hypothetical protein E6Q97_05790 [Desulfurellales bacterium]|nr:MAG: hypothetical protein E6Q97_05790 [Desulfurellales bacterium]
MTDGQEFLPTAKVTYEYAGREYWITVDEYGGADVRCFEGRGEKWRVEVRPGKTLRESWVIMSGIEIDESWVNRFDAAIVDLRGLVEA